MRTIYSKCLRELSRFSSDVQRLDAPTLCVSCGVWLPGLHDTMPLDTGQRNFPSHLTLVTD